jgi:hypothetical protein
MKVLIIAAEGAYGLRSKRIPALCRHYGIGPEEITGRFDVLKVTKGGPIDFSQETCVRALGAFARSRGYTHIVADTQNRVSFGLEENSAKDMGLLITHLELLKALTGADIISVHHKGADPKAERGRGSSVQEASFDQVIEVKRDRVAQSVMAEVKFRKDGPDGFQVPFRQIGGRGNDDAPPLLEPMSWADYKAAEATSDTLSARNVSRALVELKAHGRANAVTTRVVVHHIHESRGTLPDDPEGRDRFLKGQVNRLNERTGWDRYSGMCERDGTGKTAPWVWFVPEIEGAE